MKPYFSTEAKSLLKGLLEREPVKRLGSTEDDAKELKSHPWFGAIDWDKLNKKEVSPPFKPFVVGPEDTRNIDKMFLNETAKDTPVVSNMDAGEKKNNHFEQFTYAGGNDPKNQLSKTIYIMVISNIYNRESNKSVSEMERGRKLCEE